MVFSPDSIKKQWVLVGFEVCCKDKEGGSILFNWVVYKPWVYGAGELDAAAMVLVGFSGEANCQQTLAVRL